jgi:lactate permease
MAALIATLLQAKSIRPMLGALRQTGSTLLTAMMALVPTLILVQVFSNSGINDSGLASMPIYIGQVLAGVFGDAWVAAAPLLAAAGAFIAGSATVSTLTLAAMQDGIALAIGLPQDIILAVHMIGAAAGNVVAIHNVVAVAAVVGLAHREGHIMRKTILVVAGYLVLAAILGAVAIALT